MGKKDIVRVLLDLNECSNDAKKHWIKMRTTDTSHKGLSAGGMILNRSNRHYHNTDEKEFKGKWEYKPSCNSKNWGLVRPTNVQTLNITTIKFELICD